MSSIPAAFSEWWCRNEILKTSDVSVSLSYSDIFVETTRKKYHVKKDSLPIYPLLPKIIMKI